MGRPPVALSASIVTADLLRLQAQLDRLLAAGVDSLHVDLEDGRFVPVMNLGTRLVETAVEWGRLPVDVHLMVADPERAIGLLGALPLRTVAVHAESTRYPRRVLGMVRDRGWRAALALNPATPVPALAPLAPYVDEVLVLTSEPEDGRSPFIPGALDAVAAAVESARAVGATVVADGGIGDAEADLVAAAGADGIVVGRALLSADDLPARVRRLTKGSA